MYSLLNSCFVCVLPAANFLCCPSHILVAHLRNTILLKYTEFENITYKSNGKLTVIVRAAPHSLNYVRSQPMQPHDFFIGWWLFLAINTKNTQSGLSSARFFIGFFFFLYNDRNLQIDFRLKFSDFVFVVVVKFFLLF